MLMPYLKLFWGLAKKLKKNYQISIRSYSLASKTLLDRSSPAKITAMSAAIRSTFSILYGTNLQHRLYSSNCGLCRL